MRANDIDTLLARYFGGEANEKDLNQLDLWLAESEENEKYFENLTTIFEQANTATQSYPQPDTNKALQLFSNYIEADENKVVIQNKSKRLSLIPLITVAAGIILLVSASLLLFGPNKNAVTDKQLFADAKTLSYTLPDNTIIELEKGSYVNYNSDYGKTNRQLELVGKARFTINSTNNQHKLIVKAAETFVEDIGTVFTLEAYPTTDIVKVSVTEGEVLFYSENDKGISITEDESAIYYKKTRLFDKLTDVNPALNTTQQKAYFQFNATPMSEVIGQLSDYYNINIVVNDSYIRNQQITVTFENEDFDTIIEIIAQTLHLKIKKEGNTYLLMH